MSLPLDSLIFRPFSFFLGPLLCRKRQNKTSEVFAARFRVGFAAETTRKHVLNDIHETSEVSFHSLQ